MATIKLKQNIVLFIDVPDIDNFIAALAVQKLFNPEFLHIVLTGRPTNLKHECILPQEFISRLKSGESISSLLKRKSGEIDSTTDGRAVLIDGAARLSIFLQQCNINTKNLKIYDGGIAPSAPVSHSIHSRDFLFFDEKNRVITPESYYDRLEELNQMSPEDRRESILKNLKSYKMFSLAELEKLDPRHYTWLVGGPLTAVNQLYKRNIYPQKLIMMGGAHDNGKENSSNLFDNQFNFAADLDAVKELLCVPAPIAIDLISTETCKNSLLQLTPSILEKNNCIPIVKKLYDLWFVIGGKRPFCIFDIAPVLAYYNHNIYKFVNKKCVWNDPYVQFVECTNYSNVKLSSKTSCNFTLILQILMKILKNYAFTD